MSFLVICTFCSEAVCFIHSHCLLFPHSQFLKRNLQNEQGRPFLPNRTPFFMGGRSHTQRVASPSSWLLSLHPSQPNSVGLGYHCFLSKKILDVKALLAEKRVDGKTKEEQNLEGKLLDWLNQNSLIQILDWFRCVGYVNVTGIAGSSKWTTETTKRDRLFLKLLGVN